MARAAGAAGAAGRRRTTTVVTAAALLLAVLVLAAALASPALADKKKTSRAKTAATSAAAPQPTATAGGPKQATHPAGDKKTQKTEKAAKAPPASAQAQAAATAASRAGTTEPKPAVKAAAEAAVQDTRIPEQPAASNDDADDRTKSAVKSTKSTSDNDSAKDSAKDSHSATDAEDEAPPSTRKLVLRYIRGAWALAKEKASEGAALAWPVLEKVADSVARVLGHNDAADAHSKTMERVEELTGISVSVNTLLLSVLATAIITLVFGNIRPPKAAVNTDAEAESCEWLNKWWSKYPPAVASDNLRMAITALLNEELRKYQEEAPKEAIPGVLMLGINLGGLPKLSNVKCVTKHLPDKNFEQLVIEADVSFLPATPEEEVVAFAQAPSRKFSVTLTKLVGRACIAYQSTPAAIISVSFKPKVDIAFKLSTDSHLSLRRLENQIAVVIRRSLQAPNCLRWVWDPTGLTTNASVLSVPGLSANGTKNAPPPLLTADSRSLLAPTPGAQAEEPSSSEAPAFFVQGNWEGKLHVKIMQARDLEPKDRNGLSDPYCIAIVDSPYQKKQTKYVSNTLNPQWNYEATFDVNEGTHTLMAEVWDHDHLSRDDFQGRTTLYLASFKPNTWVRRVQRLTSGTHSGKVRGDITLLVNLEIDPEKLTTPPPSATLPDSTGMATARSIGSPTDQTRGALTREALARIPESDIAPKSPDARSVVSATSVITSVSQVVPSSSGPPKDRLKPTVVLESVLVPGSDKPKMRRLHLYRGHTFLTVKVQSARECAVCGHGLKGIFAHTYQCRECSLLVHKKCHANITEDCTRQKR